MSSLRKVVILIPFLIGSLACGLSGGTAASTATVQAPPTTASSGSSASGAPAQATKSASQPFGPTTAPSEAFMPTVAAQATSTAAAQAATPASAASVPTQTAAITIFGTQIVPPQGNTGPFANLGGISQYFNPVGQPATNWNGVPIMPSATAGQEWTAQGVYSFKAPGKIADAVSFYQMKMPTLGYTSFMPGASTGSAGTGSDAIHNSVLMYTKDNQLLLIYIASYDSDPSHISVVMSTQGQ